MGTVCFFSRLCIAQVIRNWRDFLSKEPQETLAMKQLQGFRGTVLWETHDRNTIT